MTKSQFFTYNFGNCKCFHNLCTCKGNVYESEVRLNTELEILGTSGLAKHFWGVANFFRGVVVKNICIGRVIKFKGLGWQKNNLGRKGGKMQNLFVG